MLPKPKVREDKRGRPWRDPRDVLNGILWILRTGAPWADLPDRYPPYATCFRRFKLWTKSGSFERILAALAEHLLKNGKIDMHEAFIDGTHAGAKKGALAWEKLVGALPPKSWRSQTALVFLYLPPSLQAKVMKLLLSSMLLKSDSQEESPNGSLAIKPTTAPSLRKNSRKKTFN